MLPFPLPPHPELNYSRESMKANSSQGSLFFFPDSLISLSVMSSFIHAEALARTFSHLRISKGETTQTGSDELIITFRS